jgi:hypothetical protein
MRASTHGRRQRSTWAWLVTASASIVALVTVALAIWWVASSEKRVTAYSVRGSLTAISLDLGSSDAEIVGGRDEPVVDVRRTDSFAFDRPAAARREVDDGTLRLRSRCPRIVLGSCAASYRLEVPNNVPVTIRTGSGDVRLNGFRGSARIDTGTGDIDADAYCGFVLRAQAESGNVSATASCAPERLELRTQTGRVRAVVPAGRYRIDADSDEGEHRVRGLTAADDAPFQILALSRTGDVLLEAAP